MEQRRPVRGEHESGVQTSIVVNNRDLNIDEQILGIIIVAIILLPYSFPLEESDHFLNTCLLELSERDDSAGGKLKADGKKIRIGCSKHDGSP